MARIPKHELIEITGRRRPAAQAKWFKDHLGAALPVDSQGPIVTPAAFEALVAKQCGLQQIGSPAPERPSVKLVRKNHATA